MFEVFYALAHKPYTDFRWWWRWRSMNASLQSATSITIVHLFLSALVSSNDVSSQLSIASVRQLIQSDQSWRFDYEVSVICIFSQANSSAAPERTELLDFDIVGLVRCKYSDVPSAQNHCMLRVFQAGSTEGRSYHRSLKLDATRNKIFPFSGYQLVLHDKSATCSTHHELRVYRARQEIFTSNIRKQKKVQKGHSIRTRCLPVAIGLCSENDCRYALQSRPIGRVQHRNGFRLSRR